LNVAEQISGYLRLQPVEIGKDFANLTLYPNLSIFHCR